MEYYSEKLTWLWMHWRMHSISMQSLIDDDSHGDDNDDLKITLLWPYRYYACALKNAFFCLVSLFENKKSVIQAGVSQWARRRYLLWVPTRARTHLTTNEMIFQSICSIWCSRKQIAWLQCICYIVIASLIIVKQNKVWKKKKQRKKILQRRIVTYIAIEPFPNVINLCATI